MNALASTLVRRESVAVPETLLLAAYVAGCLLTWSLLPLLGHWNVPADNLEQLAWVLTPDWGYAKHPPFPTWVLWGFEQVFPHGLPLTYLLGGLQGAMMLAIAWRLACETLDARRALVAVLLISGMTYYTNRLHFFNHNTALMVCHAGAAYCVWRCVSSGRLLWWSLLGLCWGAGLLSKYQMLVSIACNVGFLAWLSLQPAWRSERTEFAKGVLLAGALTAAMLTPHVIWLLRNDFPTFGYASHIVGADLPLWKRPIGLVGFLANQIWRVAPVAVLGWWLQRRVAHPLATNEGCADRSATVRSFYVAHAIGPFALMALIALAGGVELQMHWGTAFLWGLAPLALLCQAGRRLASLPPRQLFVGLLLVQLLTLTYQGILRAG